MPIASGFTGEIPSFLKKSPTAAHSLTTIRLVDEQNQPPQPKPPIIEQNDSSESSAYEKPSLLELHEVPSQRSAKRNSNRSPVFEVHEVPLEKPSRKSDRASVIEIHEVPMEKSGRKSKELPEMIEIHEFPVEKAPKKNERPATIVEFRSERPSPTAKTQVIEVYHTPERQRRTPTPSLIEIYHTPDKQRKIESASIIPNEPRKPKQSIEIHRKPKSGSFLTGAEGRSRCFRSVN